MARFLLIDQNAAQELLDVLGKEFLNARNERLVRLLRLSNQLVMVDGLGRKRDWPGPDERLDVRDSVSLVRISDRRRRSIANAIGVHDATETAVVSWDSENR